MYLVLRLYFDCSIFFDRLCLRILCPFGSSSLNSVSWQKLDEQVNISTPFHGPFWHSAYSFYFSVSESESIVLILFSLYLVLQFNLFHWKKTFIRFLRLFYFGFIYCKLVCLFAFIAMFIISAHSSFDCLLQNKIIFCFWIYLFWSSLPTHFFPSFCSSSSVGAHQPFKRRSLWLIIPLPSYTLNLVVLERTGSDLSAGF